MILIYFRPPSYLPCYNSKILFTYGPEQITAASFLKQHGLNNAEW